MTLPTDRSTSSTTQNHLDDHNTLHGRHNLGAGLPVFNVQDPAFGAKGDGVTDDTAAIQAAIDAAADNWNAGIVFFPAVDTSAGTAGDIGYRVSQLNWKRHTWLVGEGQYRSVLKQLSGVDASMIVSEISLPGTEFFHWSRMSHLRLLGHKPGNSVSSGVEINCRLGEGFEIEHVFLQGWNDYGIWARRGGQPGMGLHDIHGFAPGKNLIRLDRQSGDIWQNVSLRNISVDNTDEASIYVNWIGSGSNRNAMMIENVKAEYNTNGKSDPAIQIHGGFGGSPIVIRNVNHYRVGGASIDNDALIKLTGTNDSPGHSVLILELLIGDFVNYIRDDVNSIVVPRPHANAPLLYGIYRDKMLQTHHRAGWTQLTLAQGYNLRAGSIRSGPGTPEGTLDGRPGDMWLRIDGGAGTTLYIKESGTDTNTGWTAK